MNEQFDLKIPLYDNGNTNKSYIKHFNKAEYTKQIVCIRFLNY